MPNTLLLIKNVAAWAWLVLVVTLAEFLATKLLRVSPGGEILFIIVFWYWTLSSIEVITRGREIAEEATKEDR